MSVKENAAKNFYILIGLLKASQDFINLLIIEKEVSHDQKRRVNDLSKQISAYQTLSLITLPAEIKKQWTAEWGKDYLTIVELLQTWMDLDEERRELLVDLAAAVKSGEITVDMEGSNNNG